MFKKYIKIICIIQCLLIIGCGSTNNNYKSDNIENKTNIKKQKTEKEKAVEARGYYFSKLGNVNYINGKKCLNMEIESDKGLSSRKINNTENSSESIIYALDNDFDSVKIDIRQLRDGHWILHKDEETGRSVGTTGSKIRKIESLKSKDIQYIKMRNMKTGELVNENPLFLEEALKIFSINRKNQKINIELNTNLNEFNAKILDYMVFSILPKDSYYFSSKDLKSLTYIRERNKDVYLVYIQPAAKKSLILLKKEMNKLNNVDENSNQAKKEFYYLNKYYKENRIDLASNFSFLDKSLINNYGLSVDIRHFEESHKKLMNKSLKHNIKIFTYSINGQKYHEDVLKNINKKFLPNKVLINSSSYHFCSQFEVPKKENFISNDLVAMDIYNLPLDFDLTRGELFETYSESKLYPSVDGTLKSLSNNLKNENINEKETISITKKEVNLEIGKREQEVDFILENNKKIEIDLKENNDD